MMIVQDLSWGGNGRGEGDEVRRKMEVRE